MALQEKFDNSGNTGANNIAETVNVILEKIYHYAVEGKSLDPGKYEETFQKLNKQLTGYDPEIKKIRVSYTIIFRNFFF